MRLWKRHQWWHVSYQTIEDGGRYYKGDGNYKVKNKLNDETIAELRRYIATQVSQKTGRDIPAGSLTITSLTRIRDCDWVITLPDRMDAVREIAREALDQSQEQTP